MTSPEPYRHTQRSPLGPAFTVAAIGCLVVAVLFEAPFVRMLCLAMAVIAALLAAMLSRLSFHEQDDALRVRFGPLPWGGTTLRYDRVRAVRRARSSFVDGWGIHWFPGRGWTFNLWGFDCVEVTTDRGLVRLGTDDPDGLARHLLQRAGPPGG